MPMKGRDSRESNPVEFDWKEISYSLDGNAAIIKQHDDEGSAGDLEGRFTPPMKPEATVARPCRVGLRHVKDPLLTEDDELTL